MPSFHVIVAGGGIGGLCLAQGLRKAGVSCAVYESAPDIVRTGYRLHMNGDGGRALQRCLPDPLFELYAQTSRVAPRRALMVHLDHLGNELGTRPHIDPPNDPVRPHTAVNRRTLRQIMAVGLEDVLHFGHTISGFEADEDGVRLSFEDGSSATGDVLVAADGINSVVRGQLLPEVPVVDTGLRGLYAVAPLTDALAAALPDGVFDGFSMASAPNGAVLVAGVYQPRRPIAEAVAELVPGAAVDPVGPYVMAGLFAPPHGDLFPGDEELRRATSEARHAVMCEVVKDWHPGLSALVERADRSTVFPVAVRHLQPADPWPTSRVTLLGDAIHGMPPSYGTGANTTLRDAAALTETLSRVARGEAPLLEAIAAYEEEMRAEVFPILRASSDPRAQEPEFVPEDLPVAKV
ncbi:NAD(P)/FAD-dependent oxidoreductase [Streptomyces scabiei]|uniref:FAD-dependent oxidoreductase n=1 Tax=Streptomyces scabiei TaxID=1930 RepID=UPI0029BB8436|nr:NAD(P)/FAD-dependent oxidoreductase [Streptomyces scabiei]MDX3520613.1 NAD(P)/FAD-dependent oxidoreductase [Streptomyces scabiei]